MREYCLIIQDLLELVITITDEDPVGDDNLVDRITIPFSAELRADAQFGPPMTHSGLCGLKCENDAVFLCSIAILGFLALPVIIALLPIICIGVCIFYYVVSQCD